MDQSCNYDGNIKYFFWCVYIVITAHVGAIKNGNVWSRFIFPLWFMGGFQFSWAVVNNFLHHFAYVLLCNPILFSLWKERVLHYWGQQDCLPWGVCCVALCGFTIACWFYA